MDTEMKDMIDNIQSRYDTLFKLACNMENALRATVDNRDDARYIATKAIRDFCDFTASVWEYSNKQKFEKSTQEMFIQMEAILKNLKYTADFAGDEVKQKYNYLNDMVKQLNNNRETA